MRAKVKRRRKKYKRVAGSDRTAAKARTRRGLLYEINSVVPLFTLILLAITAWYAIKQWKASDISAQAAASAANTAHDTLIEMQSGGGAHDTHTLADQAVTQATQTTKLANAAKDESNQMKHLASNALAQATETNNLANQAARTANTAVEQLHLSEKQLETTERAWISILGASAEELHWAPNGISLTIKVNYKNVGNLPATNLWADVRLFLAKSGGGYLLDEAKAKQQQICEEDKDSNTSLNRLSLRQILFPDQSNNQIVSEGYRIEDEIDSSGQVQPFIVGCVNYVFLSSQRIHQTGFILEVSRKNPHTSAIIKDSPIPSSELTVDDFVNGAATVD